MLCADYSNSPEKATWSETLFKIDRCSSSCEYLICSDSGIRKTKQTSITDVKSIAVQCTAFSVSLLIFSAFLVLSNNYSGQFTDSAGEGEGEIEYSISKKTNTLA